MNLSKYFEIVQGTVEDVHDPEAKSRVKVRLDGYHTKIDHGMDAFGIPTEDLDWYPVMLPTTSSSRRGVGSSPSGLRVNDRVVVMILDEFIQSAIVIGTIHGDGDVAELAVGDATGLSSDNVINANSNRSRATRPDIRHYDRDLMEVDDVGFQTFFKALEFEEGVRYTPYYDQNRLPHIGIGTLLIHRYNYPLNQSWKFVEQKLGRKIPERRITYDEAVKMAMNDIRRFQSEISRFPQLNDVYNSVSSTRQYGLLLMIYQMGTGGVAGFKNSLRYIKEEDWDKAYSNLLKSAWARQTPQRAVRVATVIRDNNFSAYPILNKGKSRSMSRSGLWLPTGKTFDVETVEDLQVQIMDETRKLRSFKRVSSVEDIQTLLDDILHFRNFLGSFESMKSQIDDMVETAGDIDAIHFIEKYLESFKRTIRRIIDDVAKFISNVFREAVEAIKKIAEVIKMVAEEIIQRITNIGQEIGNKISQMNTKYHEEVEEEEESGIMFTEPPYEYAGEYPYVKTEVSESGHVFEVDDTPGFERIREQHTSGTYREINHSGRVVEKSVNDRYIFVDGNDHLHINGSGKISIHGNHIINIVGNSIQVVNGDLKQVVRGNTNIEVDGDLEVLAQSDANIHVEGNVKLDVDKNVEAEVKGTTDIVAKDEVNIKAEADVNAEVKGNMETKVGGDYSLLTEGAITIKGSSVDFDYI